MSPYELARKLDRAQTEIERTWAQFKMSREILTDAEVEGDSADKLLLYLIVKGCMDEQS